MSDDLKTGRKTPPKDDEWEGIWDSLKRSNRMWPVMAPIIAVVENWKALLIVAGVVAFIRGPELIEVIAAYFRGEI